MRSPFRRRPPRLAGANSVLSPSQRRLAPLALLLLLASLVLLVLSRRTGRVDVSSSSSSSSSSSTRSATSKSATTSSYSSSSSLRLPPAVTAFHARLDDLKLGAFNPGVVAASLREVLAGGEGAAAPALDDDAADDASGNKGAASSPRHLPDPALTASFSALVRDIRASAASPPSPLLECDRDHTLPPLASLRLRKEGGGKEGGKGLGGEGGKGAAGGGNENEEEDSLLERPRLLLAANLKDSAAVLPHWLLSALGTGARLPSRDFFLSVVESGSEEGGVGGGVGGGRGRGMGGRGRGGNGDGGATRAWLSLLSRLASLADVRAWVAADAAPPRARGQDRIAHLASLRNAALSPLWSRGPAAAAAAAARAELEARRAAIAAATAAAATDSATDIASGGAKESSSSSSGRAKKNKRLGLDLDLLLDLGAERAAAEEDEDSPSSTSTSVFSTSFAGANRVAFVNDVFFCPDDVARLLAHTAASFVQQGNRKRSREEEGGKASSSSSSSSPSLVPLPVPAAGPADLACGLDLYRDSRKGPLRGMFGGGPWKGVPGEEILPWGERGPPLDERGGARRRKPPQRQRSSSSNNNEDPNSPPPHSRHDSLLLYDVWVSRDASGLPLSARPPFARHQYSIDRAERGLPFPVACCWNGLAVFSSRPFLGEEGEEPPPLRFRAASGNGSSSESKSSSGEGGRGKGNNDDAGDGDDCPGSSECSLLCSDLHSRGRWRAVLDPGVRVSYDARTAARAREDRGKEEEEKEKESPASSSSSSSWTPPPLPLPITSVPYAPWRRVRASPPLDWGFAPAKFHLTCCPKGGEDDDVVHWEGCSWGGGVRPLERKGG